MRAFRLVLQFLLPLLVIAGGSYVAYRIYNSKTQPIVAPVVDIGPAVRVATARPTNAQLDITARGSVEALRTVDLAAEVGGRIVKTHPALRVGGMFSPNDVLCEIDATDYELMITQQAAAVARAKLRLLQEQAEAAAAIRAWEQIESSPPIDPLARREPQIHDAELALAAAEAQLKRAETDLARTKIQLPFAGRVRSVHADIGQTVQRGQRLAVVLDTSELEVHLPIPIRATAFVDLPLTERTDDGPDVELTANFAGERCTWLGKIVRVDGEVDRRTRQLTAIARVTASADAKPLLVGMFVEARISGRIAENVYRVPSSALHSGNHIWVLTAEPSEGPELPEYVLRDRTVTVLRNEREHAILTRGLDPGDIICLSNLPAPIDGMAVRIANNTDATTSLGGK